MGFMEKFGEAIIGGVGSLGGAALQARAQNKATSAQEKANAATLAYTKEKEARDRAEALRREGLWQTQYNDWNKARNAALQRYGFDFQFSPLSGYGMEAPSGQQAVPRAAVRRPSPSPYASMVQGDIAAEDSPGSRDLRGEVGDWADWRNYGLR